MYMSLKMNFPFISEDTFSVNHFPYVSNQGSNLNSDKNSDSIPYKAIHKMDLKISYCLAKQIIFFTKHKSMGCLSY